MSPSNVVVPFKCAYEENIKGTLEPGKLADMVVLNGGPLTMDAEQLFSTQVDLTILGGKVDYDRSRATRWR